MSTAAQWQRIRAVFQAAIELPHEARDAFLAEACGTDASLRREVGSLLAAYTAAGGFLERPALRLEGTPFAGAAPVVAAGDQLGRFEVTGALGAGGMGEVYRARDTQLNRDVAIKILPPTFAVDPHRLARFARESRVLASLKHPNIAAIHTIEEINGLRLLVLELVEGPTLAERVKGGPVRVPEALAIVRQLALALDAAHRRGIVHRDLKPANVKVSPSGHVTLLDFGLAKGPALVDSLVAEACVDAETTAGLILGTWAYMSPEQARGGAVDRRADIWAFGCVLFELLTGRTAFRGETPSDTLVAVLDRQPDWSALPADLPSPVLRVLRRCLEKDAADRLLDIGDALVEIDDALQTCAVERTSAPQDHAGGGSFPAPGVAAAEAPRQPLRHRVTAKRRLTGVLVSATVIAVGVSGWLLVRPALRIESLAVLPFENRGTDRDAEYLGDELAENLIGQMSRVPSLTVMARGTTARFRGSADPRGAGRALGVGAVVSGAVSRRRERLVIAVELIDVRSGARLWGATYDRPSTDLPQLEDTIVLEIVDALRLRLAEPDKEALLGHGTRSPEAHELVMRARHLLMSDSEEGDLEARALFDRAATLDPTFTEAHLGVAATHLRAAANGYAPPGEARQPASVALDRVLTVDPGNVRARAAKASLLYQRDWNWPAADREFRALTADPRLYVGIQYHAPAIFYSAVGRPDTAAAIVERALKADPGNVESRVMLCDFLGEAGRLADAATCYRALADLARADPRPLFGLAEVLRRRGDVAEAIEALHGAYTFSDEAIGTRALVAARTEGDYRAAELAVARARLADLQGLASERYVSPLDLARLLSQTGEREAAFAALDRAVVERSPMLVLLRVDRAWDRIRDDPRFAAVVRRIGIP